jgi:membrane protein DedA with SNARE-associated domain
MMTTFCTIVACLGAFIGAALGTWAGDRLLERRLRERERREAEDRESRDWLREGDRQ